MDSMPKYVDLEEIDGIPHRECIDCGKSRFTHDITKWVDGYVYVQRKYDNWE